jgi:type IV secretory pathway VirB2 component (pilin)
MRRSPPRRFGPTPADAGGTSLKEEVVKITKGTLTTVSIIAAVVAVGLMISHGWFLASWAWALAWGCAAVWALLK